MLSVGVTVETHHENHHPSVDRDFGPRWEGIHEGNDI